MSVSWSRQDPDLLLSAGKDGKVLCWNPNNTQPGGELLSEISHQQQWVFDVSWCPRDPSLMVTASFDQQVAVHSLLGGSRPEISTHNQSNIMESFGGADSFSALPAVARCAAPPPAPAPLLPRAPAWLKRPVGSKFCVSTTVMRLQLQHHGVVRRRGLVQRAAGRGALCRAAARARPAAAARARLAQEARGLQVLCEYYCHATATTTSWSRSAARTRSARCRPWRAVPRRRPRPPRCCRARPPGSRGPWAPSSV
ncbi:hypothetical protein PYW07_005455 [Mythimna separata]|uniref:Protein transport protein SEC31 n=1 Tax=Mythimna separata TaxID=271217 RepID=A0AAD8DPJ0_MYTSE|nr:hypothetical protein PYW07_005455 [Mythimna separata]